MSAAHKVVMLAYADAQVLDVTGPLEVFARTSRWLCDHGGHAVPPYSVEITAPEAGPVRMSSGLELVAHRAWRDVDDADTLLVAGGIGYAAAADPELLAWLRAQSARALRIGSICTGAMLLGAAGLLEGRRATTHWAYFDRLQASAPTCKVERDAIWVQDGDVWSSAGVTAGMDLALALVEADWGKAVALAVAQELVIYRKRPGGQGQFSRFLEAERRNDRTGELQLWILDHLDRDLSVPRLAEAAGMSERHLSRRFKAETGASPADYVERVRVEEARHRLETGSAQLKDLARQCGFADEQTLRRAFRRRLGVLPSDYREQFGA
jgi:transcriptional regulator GlxA family with amidase domain